MIIDTNFVCFKKIIKKIFNEVLLEHGAFGIPSAVSVNYVSEDEIKRLNSEYRKVDKCTDVLSFPQNDIVNGKDLKKFLDKELGILTLGDIVICKKVAKRQAKEYRHSFKRELCFLATHGLLHLLGYDHENSEEEKNMQEIAEKILERCGVRR